LLQSRALLRSRVCDFVFGASVNGFGGYAAPKRMLDARLGGAMAPWVVHDLRRTCSTGMAAIGIAPHVIEAVLNHTGGHKAGVAGIYNRWTYEPEKRAALDAWAAHVMATVCGRGFAASGAAPEGLPTNAAPLRA
jgi:hypothetical protein